MWRRTPLFSCVLLFYGVCVSVRVCESSFVVGSSGTVCLLRFDGILFYFLVPLCLRECRLYWNFCASSQELVCKFRNLSASFGALQRIGIANFSDLHQSCRRRRRNLWDLYQVYPCCQFFDNASELSKNRQHRYKFQEKLVHDRMNWCASLQMMWSHRKLCDSESHNSRMRMRVHHKAHTTPKK